jgi:hypothetical protein
VEAPADPLAQALADVRAKHGPHALAQGWTAGSRLARSGGNLLPPWWPGQLPRVPRVVELAGPPSCGKLSLALAWLAALPTGGAVAVVDMRG